MQISFKRIFLPALLLLSLLLYYPAIWGGYHFDDIHVIVMTEAIRNVFALDRIWDTFNSRFLIGFSFAAEYAVFGLKPEVSHLINILLHGLNAFFLFLIAKRMIKPTFWGPVLCSLFFLAHPVNTQAVNILWQRSVLLVCLGILSAIYFHLKSLEEPFFKYKILAFLSLFAASFSREMSVVGPVLIFLTDGFVTGASFKVRLKRVWVYCLPAMLLLFTFFRPGRDMPDFYQFKNKAVFGGSPLSDPIAWFLSWLPKPGISLADHWVMQIYVIVYYWKLWLWPAGLCIDYAVTPITSLGDIRIIHSLFVLIAGILAASIFKRKAPLFTFALLWFFTAIAVETLTPMVDPIFEHRMYIPGIAFALIAGYVLSMGSLLRTFGIVLLILLSTVCYQRNLVWADPVLLWKGMVERFPSSYRGRNNLGGSYMAQGMLEDALREFWIADRISPLGYATHNLGVVYQTLGYEDRAMRFLKQDQPKNTAAGSIYRLALLDYQSGDLESAVRKAERSVKINHHSIQSKLSYAALLGKSGRIKEAADIYTELIRIDPKNVGALRGLAITAVKLGEFETGLYYFETALKESPDNQVIKDDVEKLKRIMQQQRENSDE